MTDVTIRFFSQVLLGWVEHVIPEFRPAWGEEGDRYFFRWIPVPQDLLHSLSKEEGTVGWVREVRDHLYERWESTRMTETTRVHTHKGVLKVVRDYNVHGCGCREPIGGGSRTLCNGARILAQKIKVIGSKRLVLVPKEKEPLPWQLQQEPTGKCHPYGDSSHCYRIGGPCKPPGEDEEWNGLCVYQARQF